MTSFLRTIVSASMILCLCWSPAFGQTLASGASPQSGSSVTHAIKLDGGIGSPTGFGGLNYVLEPVSWFQLEAGVGVGSSGFLFSLMPKISVGGAHHRFVAGVGVSLALYPDKEIEEIEELHVWLNLDVAGYERRFDNGLFVSLSGGLTMLVDNDDLRDTARSSEKRIRWVPMPQGRVSFGYRF